MKKPEALVQLLEELQGESIRSDVEVTKASKAVIYIDAEAAANDDGIELSAKECGLLFANHSVVERLVDALNSGGATLTLFEIEVSPAALEQLERGFAAIDEG